MNRKGDREELNKKRKNCQMSGGKEDTDRKRRIDDDNGGGGVGGGACFHGNSGGGGGGGGGDDEIFWLRDNNGGGGGIDNEIFRRKQNNASGGDEKMYKDDDDDLCALSLRCGPKEPSPTPTPSPPPQQQQQNEFEFSSLINPSQPFMNPPPPLINPSQAFMNPSSSLINPSPPLTNPLPPQQNFHQICNIPHFLVNPTGQPLWSPPQPPPIEPPQQQPVNTRPPRGTSTGTSSATRRNPTQLPRGGKSEVVPAPYPWATNRRATVHSLQHLKAENITTITGDVQCKRCEKQYQMGYDLEEKFLELWRFIEKNKAGMRDRAPNVWMCPVLPSCRYCQQENCAKPVISEKKKGINWLFLLLGQMLGCCTLEQLKYFCKHTRNHRTGAKDRVLYLTYLSLCKQLDPKGPFDR